MVRNNLNEKAPEVDPAERRQERPVSPPEAGPADVVNEASSPQEAGGWEQAADDPAVQAERIAVLEDEVAALKDQHLRALAEIENVRRRAQRDREEAAKFGAAGFARDLLTVADNLRRAISSVPSDARAGDAALEALVAGVEMVERELLIAFEKHGIQKIDPEGQRFDPNLHQAMFEVENSGRPAGTVAQVLQPGYVLNGRLLRAAMVGVAKGEPPAAEAPRVDTKV